MRIAHPLLAAIAAIGLLGCGGADSTKITALESRISQLAAANEAMNMRLDMLKFEVELGDWEKFAFLRPGDQGYSTVRYDLGVLTVRLTDIRPYANGSKVTINFGNLTSARVDGLKAKLDWGKVNEKGEPQNDVAKSRDVTFSEPLPAGAWTNAEVVLEGIPPTELGFVRLRELGHKGIGLRR